MFNLILFQILTKLAIFLQLITLFRTDNVFENAKLARGIKFIVS